jgi:membrane protein DedA with SNARE-associated domain/membrane-associated phospholipid phosphatase
VSPARIAAAVLAVLLAGFVIWRRRRLPGERVLIGLAAAAALAVYASGLLSLLPDPKKAIVDIAHALGPWTYALVGVFAFLETGAFIGLIAPGETVVMAGGVIAGQGEIQLLPLIGVVWACAVLGDTTSFFIGRRLGRRFLERHGPKVNITPQRLEQVEGYFERHGGKTILIGRFIGLVRALAPFVAGSSGFAYRRFIPYSIVGTGLWATLFCVLGDIFWRSFDRVAGLAGQALAGFAIVVAVAVGVVWVARRLRDPEQRRRIGEWLDRQERKRVVGPPLAAARVVGRGVGRPLGRLFAPEPLELTTVLAVAGIGAYACALNAFEVGRDPGPSLLDQRALDLAGRLRSAALVDVAKVVSAFGTFPSVATLVLITAVVLASKGRRAEPVALVVGFLLVFLAAQLMKAGFDRPRPAGALVATRGSAFPSGHAANSTAWVAAAVAVWSWLGLAGRASLVLAAVAASAAIGLSRVYLEVHWLSDVVAGWGLGAAIFGLMAAIALIVTHIRHNERPWTSTSPQSRSPSP